MGKINGLSNNYCNLIMNHEISLFFLLTLIYYGFFEIWKFFLVKIVNINYKKYLKHLIFFLNLFITLQQFYQKNYVNVNLNIHSILIVLYYFFKPCMSKKNNVSNKYK